MAKAKKTPKKKKPAKRGKYEDKTIVTGSFLQIMQAAAKDAGTKSTPSEPSK